MPFVSIPNIQRRFTSNEAINMLRRFTSKEALKTHYDRQPRVTIGFLGGRARGTVIPGVVAERRRKQQEWIGTAAQNDPPLFPQSDN
jgi:hypothetical protein